MQRFAQARTISTATALAVVALLGDVAHAEGLVDLRGGASFTDDGDVEVGPTPFGSFTFPSDFDDSATVGGRVGYWFESLPWIGLAVDASHFAPDVQPSPDLDVVPVSPLLMLRAPLFDDEDVPHGRLQPFLGIGPGIFITLVDEASGYSDEAVDVGLDLHAGVRVMLSRWVGLFAQYRFTSFEAQVSDSVGGVSLDTDIELDTHHVAGGLAFTF